jgi:hypothetical protein
MVNEQDLEAYRQAERLVKEAHARAEEAVRGAGSEVPPRGWAAPEPERAAFPDLAALNALLQSARGAIPPELTRQLADALRDLLLALRAVIDFYIQLLERRPPEEPKVEDIPIR